MSYVINNELLGHYEQVPFTEDSVKTIYHIREIETFRLSLVRIHLMNNI